MQQGQAAGGLGTDPAPCCHRGMHRPQQRLCQRWHHQRLCVWLEPGLTLPPWPSLAALGAPQPLGGGTGGHSPLLLLAAAEGTLETALGVKSSLCSSDITRGCHSNVSDGEGVIGEGQAGCSAPSAPALLCAGGWVQPISPSCVRGGFPLIPAPMAVWPGHPQPSGPCLGRAGCRMRGQGPACGSEQHHPLLSPRLRGTRVSSHGPARTGLL